MALDSAQSSSERHCQAPHPRLGQAALQEAPLQHVIDDGLTNVGAAVLATAVLLAHLMGRLGFGQVMHTSWVGTTTAGTTKR